MSDTIHFTLDGQPASAAPGMTIWEVANGQGLVIPHLCHKPAPGYRPDGNCRACICLLYTSPSPRDRTRSRMPSSA